MSLERSFLSEDQFQCSICLDVFSNPVSTPCGHSFCMVCIGRYWDGAKLCRCPLCKEAFRRRPELHVNRTLREITEQYKGALGYTPPGGMGRLGGAVTKSDPVAVHALADVARRPAKHNPGSEGTDEEGEEEDEDFEILSPIAESAPCRVPLLPPPMSRRFSQRRFTLSGPGVTTQAPSCPHHHRLLELYCRTDGACICSQCSKSEHQSHDTVSAKKEWLHNKARLEVQEGEIQELITERLRRISEVKDSLNNIKSSAERELQGTLRLFSSLVGSLERCQAELLDVMEVKRQVTELQAVNVLRELEQEVTDLRRRADDLLQLTQSADYVSNLKSLPTLCTTLPPVKDWSSVTSDLSPGDVYRKVCHLVERFQEELRTLPNMSEQDPAEVSQLVYQPKVKRIQEYAVDVTLDASTAHPRLILSDDLKRVKCGERPQNVPDSPERFNRVVCVLGRQGFTSGRHYWEVEVGDQTEWDLGVARRSINRKGKVRINPSNGYWFLSLRDRKRGPTRKEPSNELAPELRPRRIGVFLDYEKGQVSFYNVDSMLHIYTFVDTFYETLHPFFSPSTIQTGRKDTPLIISPVHMAQ